MGSSGFEPLKAKSQQIYSLSPLAARATPRNTYILDCLIRNEDCLAVLMEETAIATSSLASCHKDATAVSLMILASASNSSQ